MIKVLNQYFPGRLFVLLASENILILLIWMAVSVQFGTWDVTAHHILILKALVATAICQLCLYYADVYDLRSMESRSAYRARRWAAERTATARMSRAKTATNSVAAGTDRPNGGTAWPAGSCRAGNNRIGRVAPSVWSYREFGRNQWWAGGPC